ncbi:metaxin-2 isoform X8 [Rhipicephalus microplus]|uniref:metaxin-2 isoform X8 n=1 Tax=Rhipicephalus microplus TaxID=6941 RepID=UPI003F6AAE2F
MPSVLLADSIAVELGANQPWPDDAKLLQSFEKSQVLLPESTSSLGVQTFLRMAGLDHEVEMRPNVESISPSGNVPVLKCGPFVIAEMDSIVAFVNTKGIQLTQNMSVQQKADIRAYMSLINTVLVNAELYICWANDATYDKVFEEVQSCCAALSERLGQSDYFFGDKKKFYSSQAPPQSIGMQSSLGDAPDPQAGNKLFQDVTVKLVVAKPLQRSDFKSVYKCEEFSHLNGRVNWMH